MIVGFDYGSSNCAIGTMADDRQVRLLELEAGRCYLPSTLYAQHNTLIVDFVAKQLANTEYGNDYRQSRLALLNGIGAIRQDLDLATGDTGIHIGQAAIDEYIDFPEEGYFVKSPKSFFGAVGLKPQQISFFEDIATAMIMQIKHRAEQQLAQTITHTVIGRPVNFQAVGGEQSNQQAVDILTVAAKRAGFKEVEFLYEPLAAGIDYESRLNQDQKVLVVDIGGGTSDCSFVQMGPSYRGRSERQQDFLSHTGKRLGGNDLDIATAYRSFMPLCGLDSTLKSGLPMPNQLYWQACKINDLHLQTEFYAQASSRHLQAMLKDVSEPEKLARLLTIQQNKLGHQVVRQGELSKIALSSDAHYVAELGCIDDDLTKLVTQTQLQDAIADSLQQICILAQDAITSAQTQPDVIYLTGGSAQSPLIKAALQQSLGDIPMLNGDNFGSVTAGLTKWATQIFK
ncbi:Chaperone protein HscA [Pseudoalteromonas holothuriae]|uniref:Chaperone protein HscA n=1 Tax=Pseudoalteromonas holothuriae TaxID=2963714 RepID=A0ABN8UP53_9GAMM|nr:molecular chaperone [Pseudoalteromonas sp. CIP111951]CAH9064240.1 Chaperone protein HscA [Pseudoalteromonas sp. CIP111951]